jgi:hypothetical protein
LCDEKRVREIIKDELGKVENNEDTVDGATQNIRAKTVKKEAVTTVIDEMNERKLSISYSVQAFCTVVVLTSLTL